MQNKWKSFTLQRKLITAFILTTLILLAVNFYTYYSINLMVTNLNKIYMSNVELNELLECLNNVQNSMTDYLNTKTTDSMEAYYRYEGEYQEKISNLNDRATSNSQLLMEKNIKNMSQEYLNVTEQTIEAKRGRNVEKYKVYFENTQTLYDYINIYINSLNNGQFIENSNQYKSLNNMVYYMERGCNVMLVIIAVCNLLLIILLTRNITAPLRRLAMTADTVAGGNLDIDLLEVTSEDEIGVVSNAFNQMLISIREYIEKLKTSMETERQMKENELLMETHLKDAQLRYLQAQINPHFLFNTLNAGAQLAMMESADRTYEYIQNVAHFFRYNLKKNNEVVTIRDEIELVDYYVYILNVRFSGEIHFEKEIDETLLDTRIPSMILQPIVENAVNYGIRDIPWEGIITLSLSKKENRICLSVKDNGIGILQDKIDKILSSQLKSSDISDQSNGIGLDNVIARLKIFYEDEKVFDIRSEGEDLGTEVLIMIPEEYAIGRGRTDV